MSFPLPSTDNELTIGPLDRQSTAEEKEPASPVPWGEALTDNEKTIERPSEPTIAPPVGPLPDLDQITWARIELFDNGKSSKGMSRFVVSITATDLPVDEVDTWSSRKNTKRFANMQNPTAFRKAIRNLPADTLTRLEDLRQEVIEHNQFRKALDTRDAMIGSLCVNNPPHGTVVFRQHTVMMFWEQRQIDGAWMDCPTVILAFDGERATIDLKPMTTPGRDRRASKFVGYFQTDAYLEHKQAQFRAKLKKH